MRVGAIVPVHGWAPYLAEALDSVLAEEPDEIAVVDDASSPPVALPGSPDGAGWPAAPLLVRRHVRGGPAAARATGLEALGACEAVALCDADDAWRPGHLRLQVAALADADVAVGRPELVGPDGRPTGERWEAIPAGPFVPPFDRNPISSSSVVIRGEALEAAGGFASPLERAEDWDLWLRLAEAGARFVSVPEAVVATRRRHGALTSDVAALARGQLAVHAAHAGRAGEEERRRVEAADRRALAAGLIRQRRYAAARAELRAAGGDPLRTAVLAVPLLRNMLGRRDPYRR
jgi:glycosyltransferase involved in cell wall biosynthesis